MDKCRLDEKDLIELLKWWKDKIDNNGLVFLYGKEFIDCITNWNYTEAIKYLTENKMLSDDYLKKKPTKRMGLNNLFEICPFLKTFIKIGLKQSKQRFGRLKKAASFPSFEKSSLLIAPFPGFVLIKIRKLKRSSKF